MSTKAKNISVQCTIVHATYTNRILNVKIKYALYELIINIALYPNRFKCERIFFSLRLNLCKSLSFKLYTIFSIGQNIGEFMISFYIAHSKMNELVLLRGWYRMTTVSKWRELFCQWTNRGFLYVSECARVYMWIMGCGRWLTKSDISILSIMCFTFTHLKWCSHQIIDRFNGQHQLSTHFSIYMLFCSCVLFYFLFPSFFYLYRSFSRSISLADKDDFPHFITIYVRLVFTWMKSNRNFN